MTKTKTKIDPLLQAVVRVWHGRGFVVAHRGDGLILTAAHCLPSFPKPHPASYLCERTYKALLGPLGAKRKVWAELLFADPIADIAVLGSPDNQELGEQADAYDALVAQATPLVISDAPKQGSERVELPLPGKYGGSMDVLTPERGDAYVLSLAGKRLACTVTRHGMWLAVDDGKLVKGGMSGSPIISPEGHAIGLLSTGKQNPVLVECLPGRFFKG
jgi:hypothetical protein